MLFAAAGLAAEPNGKVLKNGVTDGTFVRIEQGDYAHFYVKTKTNREESFFILNPDPSLQPISTTAGNSPGAKCASVGRSGCRIYPKPAAPPASRL